MAETRAEKTTGILETDICVIGAGSGGLSVAAGASQMGARVVLIERAAMGGDCLNVGCVPSKALLAAAHAAQAQRDAAKFGIAALEPQVDWIALHAHVKGVIEEIAPMDSIARFEGLGVTVLRETAKFTGPSEVQAGETVIRAKYFVIATGSRPAVPPISGLDAVPYLTNETIFDVMGSIGHLIVVGGGPIGMELAQAHRRLGVQVTVIEQASILPKDDPEAVAVVRDRVIAEGIDLREGAALTSVAATAAGVEATLSDGIVTGTHILIATGRQPVTEGLDLEAAGVAFDRTGVTVDKHLRTANRRIFAIGDVTGGYQFTHMAGYDAGIVIRQALFKMFWAKVDHKAVPWVTYTDPELAQVGMTEAEAAKRYGPGKFQILRWGFAENDRARADRQIDGFVKVILDGKGRTVGATLVGAHAGELLLPWSQAVQEGRKMSALAGLIAPYPTYSEITKRVAGSAFIPKLFSERTRKLVRFLLRWGR
ncbi:FAD-dependent oxidoreductase [Rhodospirillaceae bacterium KN72]|uniref:FAD-dependent oxidoreductase n=1 Tax=Pacificispira spongiicola TaxID=2729598 RepID=A0A7Y0HFE9_9PROT|nr:FAD-dependent oxidoreductase [Pacificispira spongiicola]NMM45770.1 FAD-dependent oxidoreductase [Pacificispira spongiicola]